MPQLGSNEKPVLMTNKKNGGRIGKVLDLERLQYHNSSLMITGIVYSKNERRIHKKEDFNDSFWL